MCLVDNDQAKIFEWQEQSRARAGNNLDASLRHLPPDLFAHGAGTNMSHKAMISNAEGLAARGIATLRFNFLYSEKGSKRPDTPKLAHAAVRAAAAIANDVVTNLPLFAGGRSFGGRMASQTQADDPLPGVRSLAFLGFPLHPAGKPAVDRAAHSRKRENRAGVGIGSHARQDFPTRRET